MSDPLTVIVASSIFHGLSMEQCQAFVPIARPQHVAKGEYLFRLGQSAPTLFIIRSGVVELTMPLSMRGKDQEVTVEEARAGETVAWSALIAPYRFTMSARAGSDVELLGFSPPDLRAALAAQPDVGLRILNNLAQVIARRLQVTQTMWTRELQRTVNVTFGSA
ncbi:MAG: cyclic nucleotide-binding domain-containing protein [Vicinamibacterales bacterium]|nr:cyclic nucleotide-binding domain-containing protein [Vicinamibacterales bacterium]